MPTLNYSDLFGSDSNSLRVPQGTESMTAYEAALAWAEGGFYVLPINNASKHAGSVVGNGWPEKSSRDPEQIGIWFDGKSNYGLALHVGKSGAIAFDVDDPKHLPYKLREWITLESTPFQSTRIDNPLRGHYLFATPPGSTYGNSKGFLKGAWGEVRGKNGIIVISPTLHSKQSEGGQYLWKRTGILPILPFELKRLLPEANHQSVQASDMRGTESFLASHTKSECPELLLWRINESTQSFLGGSRHDACRNLLLLCLKDARAGLYDAKTAIEAIASTFIIYKPQSEWSTPSEFLDMARWAIAQVLEIAIEEIDAHRVNQLRLTSHRYQDG